MSAKVLHGLETVHPPFIKGHKKCTKMYAKFYFDGELEVYKTSLTGFIRFISKSNDPSGMSSFFRVLWDDAKRLNLKTIRIEFDQCGEGMVKALKKGCEEQKFNLNSGPATRPSDDFDDSATGDNWIAEKTLEEDEPLLPPGFTTFDDIPQNL
jgi:hypothetical protein